MSYDTQKKYFEIAYKTGTDIWTNKIYQSKIFEYLSKIPHGAIALDLGTGRGRWPFAMVEIGFKVIGIDYVGRLIKVNNAEVKAKGLQGKISFLEGDVFDIQLTDGSVDVVTDFGLLQHLHREDWAKYRGEVNRVLKPGGHVLCVALSKETAKFFDLSPKDSAEADFEKYGAHYHFFTPGEIAEVYGPNFTKVADEVLFLPKEGDAFLITLLKKN